jgi:hypothetical protein
MFAAAAVAFARRGCHQLLGEMLGIIFHIIPCLCCVAINTLSAQKAAMLAASTLKYVCNMQLLVNLMRVGATMNC